MKIKLGVVFGGESVEHEVSIISAVQAMNKINQEKYDIIPICPEQLGGLKTPRVPSEIKGDEVYSKENKNVTTNFLEGSRKVANIALYNRIKKAILKESSPSCGVHNVYDGNFDNKLIEGNGITTKKLKSLGIECYTIEEFYEKYIENK